jgi:hypothetical protein
MRSRATWFLILLGAVGCSTGQGPTAAHGAAGASGAAGIGGAPGAGGTAGVGGTAGAATTSGCHQDTDCAPVCLDCGDSEHECAGIGCINGACTSYVQPRCDCASKRCGDACDQCATTHSLCEPGFCDASGSCVLSPAPKPECPSPPAPEQGGAGGDESGGAGGASNASP